MIDWNFWLGIFIIVSELLIGFKIESSNGILIEISSEWMRTMYNMIRYEHSGWIWKIANFKNLRFRKIFRALRGNLCTF